MAKKALIYDLDNTIYAVLSIGPVLFAPLFQLLASSGLDPARLPAIQHDLMRKPFQVVAAQHQFGDALTAQGLHLLRELRYEGPIAAYEDWAAAGRALSGHDGL